MSPEYITSRRAVAMFLALLGSLCFNHAGADDLVLRIDSGKALQISGSAQRSHQIEASSDLATWGLIHAVRDQTQWSLDDVDAPLFGRRYYRLVERQPSPILAHASWKNSIALTGERFLSEPIGGSTDVRYVKFALVMDGLPSVYFQDSASYPFHFQFATERLDPFLGMDLQAFNAQSLRIDGQEIVLGAVLWAPDENEYGIQLVGQDSYPREFVRFLYQSVDAAIIKPVGASGFYMPTFEQTAMARQEIDYLAAHGIAISSGARWSVGDSCYSDGWAIGRLVFVTAAEIDAAYIAGDLLPTDILVTDGVPAEVPFVAGLISFAPATPNSHVAILARSYGIPFLYVADEVDRQAVMGHVVVGAERLLRSLEDEFGACRWTIADLSGADATFLDQLRASKDPPELEIDAMVVHGSISWPDLGTATVDDIDHIGGKAANFGFLRRAIPDNSPVAMAFTFDLWNAYLDQPVAEGGGTLRNEIASRLAGFSWPPDIAALDAALAAVRETVRNQADFSAAHRSAIIAALNAAGFDPDRKIRFRSSTNVEDSDHFVGAGLYDSYSGCLHDDTDGDEDGPSHCDPDEPKERGVFRAMRKVYASFYNRNAFMERLRHGIDESEVGMALLVHHSFPDEIEAANGVATGSLVGSVDSTSFAPKLVTQIGANSVTNPDGGSLPEVIDVTAYRGSFGFIANPKLRQRSSLLLLGEESVMVMPDDYAELSELMMDVAIGVGRWSQNYELEFEYKKLTSGDLIVKQVRHVPDGIGAGVERPAIVNVPTIWKLFQGERGGVFGNHRLKSRWRVEFDSRWLDGDGVGSSFIQSLDLEWLPEGVPVTMIGPPSGFPGATFETIEQNVRTLVRETWQLPTAAGATDFELRMPVPSIQYDRMGAIFFPADFRQESQLRVEYSATYPEAQPEFDYDGVLTTRITDVSWLKVGEVDAPPRDGSKLVHRTVTERSVEIDIKFYWPPQLFEIIGGYTAPLEAWEETTITGLTTQPIVMSGYYSQTYRPEHHNFSEHFLFEPGLEPGMPAATLSELQAQNIRYFYTYVSGGPTEKIIAVGFDGSTRQLK